MQYEQMKTAFEHSFLVQPTYMQQLLSLLWPKIVKLIAQDKLDR